MDLRPFLNEHVLVQLRTGLVVGYVAGQGVVPVQVASRGDKAPPEPLITGFLVGKVVERHGVCAIRYADPVSNTNNIEVVLAPETIAAVSLAGEANRLTILSP